MQRIKGTLGGSLRSLNNSRVRKALPRRQSLLLMVLPFLLGLGWAYSISPVIYRDASPAQLAQGWQNVWAQLLVERYRLAVNTAVTSQEFNESLVRLLGAVDDPVSIVRSLGISDAGFLPLVERAQLNSMPPPPEPTLQGTLEPFVLGPVVLVLGAIALTLANRLVLQPTISAGARVLSRGRPRKTETPTVPAHIRDRETVPVQPVDTDESQPVLRRLSVYQASGGEYDDSWEIQSQQNAFLGECGVTAADTSFQGSSYQVSALEAWLFDKDDPVRSMTTIFATGPIINDPNARAHLESRGNMVPLEPGATSYLETNALRLRVRVIDVVWGEAGMESATTEITVWHKAGAPGQATPDDATLPTLNPAHPTRPVPPSAQQTRPARHGTEVTRPSVPPEDDLPDGARDFRPVG